MLSKLKKKLSRNRLLSKATVMVPIFLLAIFSLSVPEIASASVFDTVVHGIVSTLTGLNSVTASFVNWVAYYINLLIASVATLFIAVIIWAIGVVLQLSANVVNTIAVQAGFKVTLAFANLGFVIAIIIMALATILRIESFGMKKMFGKLVAAAILVNFSLVIGGVLINFANQITMSFIANFPGGGNGFSGFKNFAQSISGAFASQGLWLQGFDTSGSGAALGQSIAANYTPLFGIIFTMLMVTTVVITLAGLFVTLLVRYVYLTILLIVMPLAWLLWLFPPMAGQFKKWWSEFFKWTFYAPIVTFFLYLAVATAGVMQKANSTGDPTAQLSGLGYVGDPGFAGFFTSLIGSVGASLLGTFLRMAIILGLTIGGMFVAKSMGVTGADLVTSAASKAKDTTVNFANKQRRKAQTAVLQSKGARNVADRMRSGNIPGGKLPIIGGVIQRGGSLAARGVDKANTNADMVKESAKSAPKSWDQAKKNLEGNMNWEDTFAHLAVGVKEGRIEPDMVVKGRKVSAIMDDNDLIRRYGQEGLVKDFNKVVMTNENIRAAESAMAAGQTHAIAANDVKDEYGNKVYKKGDSVPAEELAQAAKKEFLGGAKPGDFADANVNGLFGPKTKPEDISKQLQQIKDLVHYAPLIVPSLMKGMKSAALKNFIPTYEKELIAHIKDRNTELASLKARGATDAEMQNVTRELNMLDRARKGLDSSVNRIFGNQGKNKGGEKEEDHGEGESEEHH